MVRFDVAFSGFANDSAWFALAAMVFGIMGTKSGLARRLAYRVMLRIGTTYARILLALILADFLLTFLLPNGLARVVILAPVALGFIEALGLAPGGNIGRGMLLILTYTAGVFDKTIIAGMALSHQYLSIIAGTLILCGLLYAFFTYTRIGIAMQATSQNQLAAYYMGIPVKLIFSLVWAISAAVATAAGILLAPVTLIDINMGLFVALKAFAAAVLGGFGSIPGALVGGITIGLIELYAGASLPEGFKDTAPYIVLLLMLAVRPQGLFGTLGRKRV